MSLFDFLSEARNSVARERLLHNKLIYEMKLYAASHNRQIQMTEPEIDNRGYDFTVTDDVCYEALHIQSKSALFPNGARKWSINAGLLQPSWHDRDIVPDLNGLPIPGLSGATGGVLLQLINAESAKRDELVVDYKYLDIFCVFANFYGLRKWPNFSPDKAKALLASLQNSEPTDRISIPKAAFLPVSSPAALLAFRFHIPGPTNFVSNIKVANTLQRQGTDLSKCPLIQWQKIVDHWKP
jgi:hypothetical protein